MRVERKASARALLFALVLAAAIPANAPAASPDEPGTLTLGGVPCDLIPVLNADDLPGGLFSTGTCPGVRPGAYVESPKGGCTFNFLFGASDGRRYIGTAGHCILGDSPLSEDVGEKRWSAGKGPVAKDATGRRIGEFAYAILKSPKDFALIRLDRGISASPRMCYFGGPTGLNTATSGAAVLHHFGNGMLIGDLLPARTHLTNSLSSRDHVYANGLALPGDSGSGVISDDGRAVGVLVTIGAHKGSYIADAGLVGITRLSPQVARAEKVLRIKLTLKTVPLTEHSLPI